MTDNIVNFFSLLYYFTGTDTTSAFYNKSKEIGHNCFLKINGENLDKLNVIYVDNLGELNVFLKGNSNADDIYSVCW